MSLFKKIFALCLLPYAFWLVFSYEFHFIDWLNLFIHEGGHFLFTLLGEWLHFLGGTFAQLLVPLGLAAYFLYRRQKYESAFCGFWFGESCIWRHIWPTLRFKPCRCWGKEYTTGTGCSSGWEFWNTVKESQCSFT